MHLANVQARSLNRFKRKWTHMYSRVEVKRSLKAKRYGPPHLGTHRVGTRTPKRDGVQRRPSII